MTALVVDAARSRVRIQTFAEGLLARLAHDLELTCEELSGSATPDDKGGTASLEAPLRGIAVAGALGRDGRVDESSLSASERRDCLAKMRVDVFHARPEAVIRIEARLDGDAARIRLVPPNGRAVETVVRIDVRAEEEGTRATGTFELSLGAIGSEVVKGPMNAFRVKDKVKISFAVLFTPQPA